MRRREKNDQYIYNTIIRIRHHKKREGPRSTEEEEGGGDGGGGGGEGGGEVEKDEKVDDIYIREKMVRNIIYY